MPPTFSGLNRNASSLNRLSQAAKALGPDLFSPTQSAQPIKQATMQQAFKMPSAPTSFGGSSGFGAGTLGTSWANDNLFNLKLPSFGPPNLGGGFGQPTAPTSFSGGAGVGSLGGEYAVLDQYDQWFQEAAAATGMPVNRLKAIAAVERGWEGTSVAGAVGIMQIMPGIWGHLGNVYDPRSNIMVGAKVLQTLTNQHGDIDTATRAYLGFGTDAYGTSDAMYLDRVRQFESQLNASGGSFNGSTQPINGMWGGNPTGNAYVEAALQYQGVAYVWGAIPGANQNPWQTGWDCSGFTYFMNQKYGDGSLPMGSHYQYDYAVRTGKLFTNLNALQPGDLVFIDTGWQGGAGAELNRAGHVGIYIGNGQMIHAANPNQGTIVSSLSSYGGILGAMHQTGSGGGYAPGINGAMAASTGRGSSLRDSLMAFYQGRR